MAANTGFELLRGDEVGELAAPSHEELAELRALRGEVADANADGKGVTG